MMNKYETEYPGPSPKSVNSAYPNHTYDMITCLLNGESKKIIQDRYLHKLGHTKKTYLEKFPNAPTKSKSATDNYQRAALNDNGRRSANMKNLNLTDAKFQENRKKKINEFLQSSDSINHRQLLRDKAKQQHANGQAAYVQEYFLTRYQGSTDQKNRSKRMQGKNNIIHLPGAVEKSKQTYIDNHNSGFHATRKKQFKNYNLRYQSSYELHFLEYCETIGIIHLVSEPKALKDMLYPRKYYLPDYLIDNVHIVEIKSQYIESKQTSTSPGAIEEKKMLVERLGYKWLYILDKNYQELNLLFGI